MSSRIIALLQNQVAHHLETDAAYGGAALTALAAGLVSDSCLLGIVAGLACAVAWLARTQGPLAALPYCASSLVVWVSISVYGALTSNTPAIYLVLFALSWALCGVFNVWFMIRVYPGDQQDRGAQVVQGGLGPLFWLLIVPAVIGFLYAYDRLDRGVRAFNCWRTGRRLD